jgi:hypothetical protein
MVIDTLARSKLLQARLHGLAFLSLDQPRATLATPDKTLNKLLPAGGLAAGSFVEVLSSQEGAGAYTLALLLARRALARREAWAVVDVEGTFYPPATAALGYDLKRLILLRPRAGEDAWAVTQLLCASDISVCFWRTSRMDNMVFRRLQLAAERGDGLGFVMRPAAAERKPCWAGLRLMASWRSNRGRPQLCARVLHAAGRFVDSAQEVEVEP